jgi:transposase
MRQGVSVTVSAADRLRLEAVVANRNSPQKHVWRARIVLLTGDGLGTVEIMRQAGKSKTAVWRWQERFMTAGVAGLLRDKTRPSRIPPLGREVIDRVLALTREDPPGEATHWTAAAMAQAVGISVSSVQRIWRSHGLQPHRVRQFKLLHDPEFVPKLRDKPNPGSRPHPARPAAEAGPVRNHDARLQAPWHDDALRRARCARWQGHRPLHAAPPASRVHPLPQHHRGGDPGGQDHPCHP